MEQKSTIILNFPFLENLYDFNTKNLFKLTPESNTKKYLRYIKYLLKGRVTPDKEIHSAMRRMDFFAWYSIEEYNYLKEEVLHLPPFLKYPFENLIKESIFARNHIKNRVLVGNSRVP